MSGRGEPLLWKIVELLSHAAIFGWIPPPPEIFGPMQPANAGTPSQAEAEAEPVIDHLELDEWLASILDAEPDSD
jgi:hypothetical protein